MKLIYDAFQKCYTDITIFTNMNQLFTYLHYKYPYINYPQNFETYTTKQLYEYLKRYNIDEDVAVYNTKVLQEYYRKMNIDYFISCNNQVVKLIEKYEQIYQTQFKTLNVDKTIRFLKDYYYQHSIETDNSKYLSYDEWFVLLYVSLFIQLMIDGKNHQSNIDYKKQNDILCLSPNELLHIKVNELQTIVDKHKSGKSKTNGDILFLNYLFNKFDWKFDMFNFESQYNTTICNILSRKIEYALRQRCKRLFMINVANDLFTLNDYDLERKILSLNGC